MWAPFIQLEPGPYLGVRVRLQEVCKVLRHTALASELVEPLQLGNTLIKGNHEEPCVQPRNAFHDTRPLAGISER